MGVADRDWYREAQPTRRRVSSGHLAAALAVIGIALVVGYHVAHRPAADPEHVVHRDLALGVGPGLTLTIKQASLYPAHDPWRDYLADDRTCPHGEDVSAPLAAQVSTMICLINFARRTRGLHDLHISPQLSRAAQLKGEAITRCRVFAHAPCGGDPHDVAVEAGFSGSWGENIYIADGRWAAPRPALDGWLNSPGHRANLFRPEWNVQSIYAVQPGAFPGGFRAPTLWVSEFGS